MAGNYFEVFSSGYNDLSSESSSDLEDEELELSDLSDDSDSDEIELDISASYDPNYQPVWSTMPPEFGVGRLEFSGTPGVNRDHITSSDPLHLFESVYR